ncbi:hypothetical protein [Peribacillus sp. FSL E2-0159]|uniref:hypothetical protein n=1 Tax=Peribacillus sp. FSL E2-0159 TaxID=2975289 RepID=UPI00315A1324
MRFLISICIVLILLSGCSNKNEQVISIQKNAGKNYTFLAYKEHFESNKTQKVMEILNKPDWEKSELNLDNERNPDYKFYFNKHERGKKIVVYSVWLSPKKDKLQLTKNDGNDYMELNKDDSKLIFETITDYENLTLN